ncbi:hypothetical protein [Ornithinimicrobium murale]|uniref:hypothetical protein n=1 Tax=Ornithinimicrobium murale TaxID=1050153 RepID=UPI001EDCC6F9|nr:hypothetical protein [Ornithinimicrobium murale]
MAERVVRGLVVLALVLDAVVHLSLASQMQLAAPGGIGGGWLFRIQAVAALAAAAYLLLRSSRTAYLVAGAVALSAFVPVLLYTYVNVPALGPIPSMYDPFWTTPKAISAVAEGLGAVLAGIGVWLTSRPVRGARHG